MRAGIGVMGGIWTVGGDVDVVLAQKGQLLLCQAKWFQCIGAGGRHTLWLATRSVTSGGIVSLWSCESLVGYVHAGGSLNFVDERYVDIYRRL
jgi:hypothetical protein